MAEVRTIFSVVPSAEELAELDEASVEIRSDSGTVVGLATVTWDEERGGIVLTTVDWSAATFSISNAPH